MIILEPNPDFMSLTTTIPDHGETFQVSLICKQCGLPVIQVVSDSLTVGLVDVVNRARGLSLDGVYVVTAQLLSRYGMGVK
jgi:hypothetical protein